MAKKFSLFNFLERRLSAAEISTITTKQFATLAFKELALQIAVSYVANTISKCEFKVYENGEESKNELYYLLNVSPNPNENSSQFINKFVEKYFYEGHALIVHHNGYLYCADSFDIDDSNPLKEYIFYNVTFNCQQLKKKYKASEVFYLKLDNKDVKALIDSIYTEYGEILTSAIKAFKRNNGKKYKLLLEQYKAGDKEFNEIFESVIKKQLQSFIENEDAVYPQFKGTDLQESSTATVGNSADIIALRKEVFEIVAQAIKIPLTMMYGNITNMNEIVKVFLTFCIDPFADMVNEEFTRKNWTFNEWESGNYMKIDTSCINHVDILEAGQDIYNLIGAGFSLDEIRERLDKKLLNTEFSQAHFFSKNFSTAEEVLRGLEGGE